MVPAAPRSASLMHSAPGFLLDSHDSAPGGAFGAQEYAPDPKRLFLQKLGPDGALDTTRHDTTLACCYSSEKFWEVCDTNHTTLRWRHHVYKCTSIVY